MTLHVETPLLSSPALSDLAGRPVWLKLENLQPSGSFKLRGVGLHCERMAAAGAQLLVSSSGGNAGLATAWAGRALGVAVQVFVPRPTPEFVLGRLRQLGAEVVVTGDAWDQAHTAARAASAAPNAALIHPFEHQDLWEGHATLIDEIARAGVHPGTVVCSVGGGGLLLGILQGLEEAEWAGTSVVAVESRGAHSLAAALDAGQLVSLDAITSIASSLGARRVSKHAWRAAEERPVHSIVVEDAQVIATMRRFVDDHRMLVEPACAAALTPLYADMELPGEGPIVVVVCGGAVVNLERLEAWGKTVDEE